MNGLVVRHLRLGVRWRGDDIVQEIEFEIAGGSVLGLVGESGAGKTSVGLASLGHTRPGVEIVDGDVRVDEHPILELPPARLRTLRGRRVSYVAQDPGAGLNPALRIGPQILQVLGAHHVGGSGVERSARLADVLGEVSLPSDQEFLRRYPHQLSGGEQRRVALAIGFACRPSVIVLDEPTSGLDVSTRQLVIDTIRQLCRHHHVAALCITHDLAVVARMSDRIAVMYAGRIVEHGPTAQVLADPAHPYTHHLLAAAPDPTGSRSMVGLGGVAPRPGRRPQGCSFAARCEVAHDGCRVAVPTLDEVEPGRSVRCVSPFAVLSRIRNAGAASPGPAPGNGQTLLSVEDLSVDHGGRRVVEVAALDVDHGECLALVGPSGAGKSTLVRAIGGLHHRWTGTVRIGGVEMARAARDRTVAQRRRVQFVFQDPSRSFSPRRTIGESVGRPLRVAGVSASDARRAVGEMFERVRLDAALTGRYPEQLSGGERQRAAIARALVGQPDLLICDEVTSALDTLVQAAIVELLVDLQRERGLAMLFVTHDLALARSIASRVAVLESGRIVEIGPTGTILSEPASDQAKRMVADMFT